MTMTTTIDRNLFGRVARALLGDPDVAASRDGKWRFGQFDVSLETGEVYDREEETRGDFIDLVASVRRVTRDEATTWLTTFETVGGNGQQPALPDPAVLPDDLVDERALIGLILVQPELLKYAEEEIIADDFVLDLHRRIFTVCLDARENDYRADAKTIIGALGGNQRQDAAPGFTIGQYIAHLMAAAPFGSDAPELARSLARTVKQIADAERGEDFEPPASPPPAPFVSRFGGLPFEDLDLPGPEHEFLIDGWFTVGDKSIIGGPSKSGKSFLAIHAAGCIATGMDFFGHKVMAPGLVIYQAGEGARGIKNRFRSWRQYFGIERGRRVPIYILQSRIDIYRPAPEGHTEALIQEIRGIQTLYDVPLRALFIDTLATASGSADENSGRDMAMVMANVDRLAQAIQGCHVSLVHHFNAAGTKLRGHSSIYANIDQVVAVTKAEDSKVRTALLDKQKDGEDGFELKFELFPVEVGRRKIDDKPITSCVTLQVGESRTTFVEGKSKTTIRLSDQQTLILQALKDALVDFGEPTPPALRLPKAITTVVNVRYWREAFAKTTSEDKDNTINQRMKRASDHFQKLRVIGRINPYVWLVPGKSIAGVTEGTSQPPPQHPREEQQTMPLGEDDDLPFK